jgi:hypothetical protein
VKLSALAQLITYQNKALSDFLQQHIFLINFSEVKFALESVFWCRGVRYYWSIVRWVTARANIRPIVYYW